MNVLFDRNSLHVVGSNLSPLPFEVEIDNVDTTGLSKTVSFFEKEDKLSEGKVLYFLPQEPLVEENWVEVDVETTEVTDVPVMIEVEKKVPVLDENNKQVQYEVTQEVVVSPAEYDEEGNLIAEEVVEVVGTGRFIKCYTIEIDEVQKTDEQGLKIFLTKELVNQPIVTPQPTLEITEEDERFVEGLDKVFVDVEKHKYVTFEESPNEFTYEDIVAHKEASIHSGTFYGQGKLFETFSPEFFSTHLSDFQADIGFDFFSLPSGGNARTVKLPLPTSADLVKVIVESSNTGVIISVGDTASNLVALSDSDEVEFSSAVSEVYVKFENPTTDRIDIKSFALLV